MKRSIIAATGTVLIGPFLVLSTPTAHAWTPGECYGAANPGVCAGNACMNVAAKNDLGALQACFESTKEDPKTISHDPACAICSTEPAAPPAPEPPRPGPLPG